MELNEKPYLSFVVVGRNDNYGHKFLYRTQRFIDNLTFLCEKYKLTSEIVFIEWNPPKENKKLWEDLKISKKRNHLSIRFVEVPNSVHIKIENSDKICLFEYLGKNLGIRKSKGEFVLVTNPDIIFSPELIEMFSKKNLQKKILYRVSRFDLMKDIPEKLSEEEVISFAKKNWQREWNMHYGMSFRGLKKIKYLLRMIGRFTFPLVMKNYLPYRYHGGNPGDFMLMDKKSWKEIKGFPEYKIHTLLDLYGVILAITKFKKIKRLKQKIYHQFHDNKVTLSRPATNIWDNYINDSIKMLKTGKVIEYNKKDWGLNNIKLYEKVF